MDLSDFGPSEHQAAGHDGYMTSGSVFIKHTSQQEIDFYEQTKPPQEELPQGAHISHWMPAFMGTLSEGVIRSEEEGVTSLLADDVKTIEELDKKTPKSDKRYIVLSNLYHGFSQPSILDIKLGKVLVDDTVTEEKRLRLEEVSNSTTSGSLHFRICGMKLFKTADQSVSTFFPSMNETFSSEEETVQFNKFYGRRLEASNIDGGIAQFFAFIKNKKQRQLLLIRFYQRLQLLYNCLLDSEVRIISGSLLFIFENDPKRWEEALTDDNTYFALDSLIQDLDEEESDSEENSLVVNSPLSSLHLIDFAHSKYVKGEGHDENIIVGIENLIGIFEKLIEASE